MRLSKCLDCLGGNLLSVSAHDDPIIDKLTCDSRAVKKGALFVAIRGHKLNGEDFISQAIENGCSVVLAESEVETSVPLIKVNNSYKALAQISEFLSGFPVKSMDLIGVTGTNGKSSIAMILHWLFSQVKIASGLIGTIQISYGEKTIPATMTTPGTIELQEIFKGMQEASTEVAVLEVSSHALEQSRLGTSRFKTAVFTNLSEEHLDYHGDMAAYFQSKVTLFTELLEKEGVAIINVDDTYGSQLADLLDECISVGHSKNADWRIAHISSHAKGTDFELIDGENVYSVKSPLIGDFNVMNLAQALIAAKYNGLSLIKSLPLLADFPGIPGRLQLFTAKSGKRVVVDYAHTPDALEKSLKSLRSLTNRLICLFGCGGDRDKKKRPVMGAIAERLADEVYICDDNPRTEDHRDIVGDILSGVVKIDDVHVEYDRKNCIEMAIKDMGNDDLLLLAGKGHEDYQIIGHEKVFFCDRTLVEEIFEREKSC